MNLDVLFRLYHFVIHLMKSNTNPDNVTMDEFKLLTLMIKIQECFTDIHVCHYSTDV